MVAGKVAFVTGAGSGIGREVCRILARDGAKVIAADRNHETAEETIALIKGSDHIALHVNVANETSVDVAFKNVMRKFSRPASIVVNAAGITQDNFLLKLTQNNFNDVVNVNLKGTFLVIQNAVKEMINANACKGASIINVGSIIGKTGNLGQANYAASKAGVEALTKTACLELGNLGIRINIVLPGCIETPMLNTVPDKVKQMFIKKVPLQRLGKPIEVAEVISFLASGKSSYVNGASIHITGGMQ